MTGANWLAVIVATVASFLLGALWYSASMFGRKWAEGAAINLEAADAGKQAVKALAVQFIGTFLLAWLLGVSVDAGDWLMTAVIVGTTAFMVAAAGLFHHNSHYSVIVESAFVVAMAALMIVVHLLL